MSDWSPPEGHSGRWILACIAGLAIGMPAAALWNALILPGLAPDAARLGLLAAVFQAAGGAMAGACLGIAQATVLRRVYRDLSAPAWIAMSAAAGYGVALVTTIIYGLLAQHAGSIPIPVFIILGAVVKGVLAGLLYGSLQGRVLDTVVAERASWTRVVMVGWMLGAMLGSMRWLLGITGADTVSLVSGAVAGGAIEGLALGLVTAGAFRFMPPRTAR